MQKRIVVLFFLFSLLLGALSVRIGALTQSDLPKTASAKNSASATVGTTRGYIYDRKFRPIVNCDTVLMAAVKPSESALAQLSCAVPAEAQSRVYETISQGKIAVCTAASAFAGMDIKTVSAIVRYGENSLAAHVTGYVDGDGKGVSGIEKYYDSLLSYYAGTLKARCSVNAMGTVLSGAEITFYGDNYNCPAGIALTLDRDIQAIAEQALAEFSIETGAVVVLDTATSEIRAMASAPVFDRNNPQISLADESAPFINRAITPYSVGSVFKVVVAAAALETGVTTDFRYTCTGRYILNENGSFGCHKEDGHGTLDMYGGMAQSCNPYFINLALQTGAQPIGEMGEKLGLGQKIELADDWYAQGGIMPDAGVLQSKADLCNLAFGQGTLLASPLQMAAVYAAIANGGVYRAPSLMQSIVDASGEEMQRAELPSARRVMTETTAGTLRALLRETVVSGSGRKAEPAQCGAAGKTATAQSGWFNEAGEEITQSWFCGYFPYETPRYAIVILKENGEGGSADCAPVFKYIADGIQLADAGGELR